MRRHLNSAINCYAHLSFVCSLHLLHHFIVGFDKPGGPRERCLHGETRASLEELNKPCLLCLARFQKGSVAAARQPDRQRHAATNLANALIANVGVRRAVALGRAGRVGLAQRLQ